MCHSICNERAESNCDFEKYIFPEILTDSIRDDLALNFTCTYFDYCISKENNTCHTEATCTMTGAETYNCACNNGYSGSGTSCSNIDECTLGSHDCDTNALCTDNVGSFTCECNSGYSGDGVACVDIDECTTSDRCGSYGVSSCSNTAGSYTCNCNSDYHLTASPPSCSLTISTATVDGASYEYVWFSAVSNTDWTMAHDKCANLHDGSYQLPVPTSVTYNQWLLGFSTTNQVIALGITDITTEGSFVNHYTGKTL